MFFFFIVSVMSLSVFIVFDIDVVDNLQVDIALVEEDIVVELVEMGKGIGGKANFIFMGMNFHSYCWMLCPGETKYWLLMSFFLKMALDIVPIFMESFEDEYEIITL